MEFTFIPTDFLNGNQLPKFRIIFLGNAHVGKTSLIMRYMNNNFKDEYYPTKDIM